MIRLLQIPTVVYNGTDTSYFEAGLPDGVYWYRVRTQNSCCDSSWLEAFSSITVCSTPPVIENIIYVQCVSASGKPVISVETNATDDCGYIFDWEALDGGTITGNGSSVIFSPLGPSDLPECVPYQILVTVTSEINGMIDQELIEIYAKLAGDVNGDGRVNIIDKVMVRNAFGESGEPGWIEEDVNWDGYVNIIDKVIVRNGFGQEGCNCQ